MKRFLGAVKSARQGTSLNPPASDDNATQVSQDPRLDFLLRVIGGVETSPRYSMTEEEISSESYSGFDTGNWLTARLSDHEAA